MRSTSFTLIFLLTTLLCYSQKINDLAFHSRLNYHVKNQEETVKASIYSIPLQCKQNIDHISTQSNTDVKIDYEFEIGRATRLKNTFIGIAVMGCGGLAAGYLLMKDNTSYYGRTPTYDVGAVLAVGGGIFIVTGAIGWYHFGSKARYYKKKSNESISIDVSMGITTNGVGLILALE